MSKLDLKEFHSFLEELIEGATQDGRFSVDGTIGKILSEYPERLAKIQIYVNGLGLRALIRNNCPAKNSAATKGPDLFGHYHLGKRISVPYHDERGKLRWEKKRRGALSFDDLDRILARSNERPARQSKERQDFEDIAKRAAPYRTQTTSVREALELAYRDGR